MDVDKAMNLAGSMGIKLEVVPTSWTTLLLALTGGKFDVWMGGIFIAMQLQRVAFFN